MKFTSVGIARPEMPPPPPTQYDVRLSRSLSPLDIFWQHHILCQGRVYAVHLITGLRRGRDYAMHILAHLITGLRRGRSYAVHILAPLLIAGLRRGRDCAVQILAHSITGLR